MEIRQFVTRIAALVWKRGFPAYEALTVGSSTIVKAFASVTGYAPSGKAVVTNICNTHASNYLYVFWVPRGHATLVGGSAFTAAKCKKIIAPRGDAQFAIMNADFYLLASGADTTCTVEEMFQ